MRDRESREPAPEVAAAVVAAARVQGLLLLSCGLHGNVIRLLPPISIGPEDVAAGLDALESAVRLAGCGLSPGRRPVGVAARVPLIRRIPVYHRRRVPPAVRAPVIRTLSQR